MAFQFHCPQGHALETDESFAGQPCQCPYCGVSFPIPRPPAAYATFAGPAAPFASAPAPPAIGGYGPPGQAPAAFTPPSTAPGPAAIKVSEKPPEPEFLHIACPNGHELETPRDLLNQDVLCPHCNVQFRLREKDSVEFKRRQAQELEHRDRKAGKMWLNYAIVAAVLVVIGIVAMIAMSMSS